MSNSYNTKLQNHNSSLEDIITQLNDMPDAGNGGIDTSDATATASDILSGKIAYVNDEKITGTIETKTSSDLTASGATVTVPAGYYASNASKSVGMATQATPSVTVNSSGLITATATQSAGYVSAGSKSGTKQLTTQAAKTITPSTSNQTAVASGRYTIGAITVQGDSNLKAENIKNGVSIFGVSGILEIGGSSGGGTEIEDAFITGTIQGEYSNDRVESVRDYAFYRCTSLTSINFPVCTTIKNSAFCGCTSLTSINFPVCTTIKNSAFYGCTKLTTINFPVCTTIGSNAFNTCTSLTSINFPACTTISSSAFYTCTALNTITLLASIICTLNNSKAFYGTRITSTKGSIFVPASLVASYKTATNWAYFANRIFAYSE